MYKTIEIKDIIGCVCANMSKEYNIDMDGIRRVMKMVNEEDDFITTVFSRKAIDNVCDLLNKEIDEQSNLVPDDDSVRIEFTREYYRVDYDTRSTVANVMKKYFQQ